MLAGPKPVGDTAPAIRSRPCSPAALVLRVPALRRMSSPPTRRRRSESPVPATAHRDLPAEAEQILVWAGDQAGKASPGGLRRPGHPALDGAAPQQKRGCASNCHAAPRPGGPRRPPHLARRQGEQARIVPIAPPLAPILDDYVTSLRPALAKSGFFFVNPSSQIGGRTRAASARVGDGVGQGAGTGAGVTGRHFPHRWRHSYATSLLRRGADIHVVQRLLGHSNIATTTRYLHLCDTDLADAVEKAFPPSRATPPGASRGRRRGAARPRSGRRGRLR